MADIEGHGAVGPVQFLRNLYQARELFAGIQLFATSHTVAALEEAIARGEVLSPCDRSLLGNQLLAGVPA